jgi:hypothetical protein
LVPYFPENDYFTDGIFVERYSLSEKYNIYVYILYLSVSIETRLRAGGVKFDSQQRLEIFLLANTSILALKAKQAPIQWVQGTLIQV